MILPHDKVLQSTFAPKYYNLAKTEPRCKLVTGRQEYSLGRTTPIFPRKKKVRRCRSRAWQFCAISLPQPATTTITLLTTFFCMPHIYLSVLQHSVIAFFLNTMLENTHYQQTNRNSCKLILQSCAKDLILSILAPIHPTSPLLPYTQHSVSQDTPAP